MNGGLSEKNTLKITNVPRQKMRQINYGTLMQSNPILSPTYIQP